MIQVPFASNEDTTTQNETFKKNLLKSLELEDEKDLISLSQVKRFYERWRADKKFREQMNQNPYGVINRYNLKVDPEQVRPIWDSEFDQKRFKESGISDPLKRLQQHLAKGEKEAESKHHLPSLKNPHFKAWRERQIARVASQFDPPHHSATLHAPTSFELSRGCSIGCWFCGVSAPRLDDIFYYTQENARLWCEVLELMNTILGSAAGEGFCYWATDPLDNPDYEKFCCDFQEILGNFPQTTTAQPLKDPTRTRLLLQLSIEKGCKLNRFSILSLKALDQLYDEFSAEELAGVGLVLQNPEAGLEKANVGRVRERNKNKAGKSGEMLEKLAQPTIACVTGFLFNMVERSVKLISPCKADDRWPNGYRIYDEGIFTNVSDLETLLERMIADHMPLTVRESDRIRFRPDLKYESLSNGFQLSTQYLTRTFRNVPYLRELGEIIQEGDKTAGEIASWFKVLGVPPVNTFSSLNRLFSKGVLDDEL